MPRSTEEVPKSLKLREDIRDSLATAATAHGMDFNHLGNAAIADALEQIIPPGEVNLFRRTTNDG